MVLATLIIAFISIMAPGFFLALALLKKTGMSWFEITVFGFILGLIFPPTLTWLEAYLIPISSVFSFSAGLYEANVFLLTIIGVVLSWWQGALDFKVMGVPSPGSSQVSARESLTADYKSRVVELRHRVSALNVDMKLIRSHEQEEDELTKRHQNELSSLKNIGSEEKARLAEMHAREENGLMELHEREERSMLSGSAATTAPFFNRQTLVWVILLGLMLFTFATRIASLGIAAHFFEFDPYFDMISTQYILTYGHQLAYDHAAWPTAVNGTIHRIQPIVPYLEAYWYNLAGGNPNQNIDITLLSNVSSFYPPIMAALLVFVVFIFLYYEYGAFAGLIGAGFTTVMPALLTTFIAGEQLLEPWGIFAMFFFYATYLLAVKNMKETRYAILAGIAFASTFLGAHYYTVNAGVLAVYIALQGIVDVLRNKSTKDFYIMNAKVLAVIALFYLAYAPYNTALAQGMPLILGIIPVIVGFPLGALVLVLLFEYIPTLARERNIISSLNPTIYVIWLAILVAIASIAVFLTPLGGPVRAYLQLSQHYTTPSIPLFATVQEYAPTGFFTYNFGSSGFGLIGWSIGGLSLLVWAVLILFGVLAVRSIWESDSKISILTISAIAPLAFAGMMEVKYLPHFGVGYIIAIGFILGELLLIVKNNPHHLQRNIIYGVGIALVLIESFTMLGLFAAAANPNCATISNSGNGVGFDIYCNTVPQYWLSATNWMRTNVGPYAPRILSWWDYGDWINWFGNSNAVLRGDNAVATLDYATAARFVLGSSDGYTPANLAGFMDSIQAKYLLFDDQLVPKWGALDFLACVHANETSLAFAESQGQQYGQPYVLGTSQCELSHDPAAILIPSNFNNINNYCSFPGNSSSTALKSILVVGNQASNQTYCAPASVSTVGPTFLYNLNGTRTNIVFLPTTEFYNGQTTIGGQTYLSFTLIYLPNGKNGTITDAPSQFYSSNFYKGFFLGKLPGFNLVYPSNFTGVNYVNSSAPIMIFALNNFTGTLPYVVPKPSYIHNNYTMPG